MRRDVAPVRPAAFPPRAPMPPACRPGSTTAGAQVAAPPTCSFLWCALGEDVQMMAVDTETPRAGSAAAWAVPLTITRSAPVACHRPPLRPELMWQGFSARHDLPDDPRGVWHSAANSSNALETPSSHRRRQDDAAGVPWVSGPPRPDFARSAVTSLPSSPLPRTILLHHNHGLLSSAAQPLAWLAGGCPAARVDTLRRAGYNGPEDAWCRSRSGPRPGYRGVGLV